MKNLWPQLICLAVACFAPVGMNVSAGPAWAQSAPETTNVQWRRTVNGWERADLWQVGDLSPQTTTEREGTATAPLPPPQVHPILVAGFLLAVAGLLAIGGGSSSPAARE